VIICKTEQPRWSSLGCSSRYPLSLPHAILFSFFVLFDGENKKREQKGIIIAEALVFGFCSEKSLQDPAIEQQEILNSDNGLKVAVRAAVR